MPADLIEHLLVWAADMALTASYTLSVGVYSFSECDGMMS